MEQNNQTASLLKANAQAAEEFQSDRRGFIKHGLIFTAALGFWTSTLPKVASAALRPREVSLTNVHTGEKFNGEYWQEGRYIPEAFRDIKKLMRDHRNNQAFPIDPRLMDILFVLKHRSSTNHSFEVFSGYRSPQTNALLRQSSQGVARNSLHMQGQAIDISLPELSLSKLHRVALALKAGGVGYYPRSDFVHVDTGRVRDWHS